MNEKLKESDHLDDFAGDRTQHLHNTRRILGIKNREIMTAYQRNSCMVMNEVFWRLSKKEIKEVENWNFKTHIYNAFRTEKKESRKKNFCMWSPKKKLHTKKFPNFLNMSNHEKTHIFDIPSRRMIWNRRKMHLKFIPFNFYKTTKILMFFVDKNKEKSKV